MRPTSAALIAVAVVVTALGSYLAFLPENAGRFAFWALAAGPAWALGVGAAVWAARQEMIREWLRPRWGDFTMGALGALVLFALTWAFARLVTPVGSARAVWLVSLYGQLGDPRALQAHAPAVAAVICATALAEEVLWRGAITQLLSERVGSRTAWVWAAALYALAYVPTVWALRSAEMPAGLDPVLPLAALAGGLLWGGMARSSGRLVPGVLAHALFDWALVMMFPLWGVH